MLLFSGVAAFGMSPLQGDLNALIASCSEYTFLTKGKRVDGTMYSCTSLGVKIGGGLGTALCGWLLEWSGYDGFAAVQSASCLNTHHVSLDSYGHQSAHRPAAGADECGKRKPPDESGRSLEYNPLNLQPS